MTISSTTVKNSYSGDGSTTTFSYTFKIFQDSDIQVIIRSANGTETTKTITTHYTVTGAGNSGGGSVIFTAGNIPTSTQTVVLRRNIPQTQAIDYIANDPFPAESHEEGLDRATMAIQQLQEEVTRSLKLSKTNTMTSTEFTVGASDRANKILAFDTNGELSVTQELGTNRGSWSAGVTYNARDIVKDSSNNNVYLCNTTHTSTGTTPISSNADVAKWDLIVDAQSATNSANAAANHASNSSNFANNSSNSANTAANHASNASNFANNASNSANDAILQIVLTLQIILAIVLTHQLTTHQILATLLITVLIVQTLQLIMLQIHLTLQITVQTLLMLLAIMLATVLIMQVIVLTMLLTLVILLIHLVTMQLTHQTLLIIHLTLLTLLLMLPMLQTQREMRH